jgi:hypothetical protein
MHEIEPYFNWRHLYTAEEDENSPFFGREYSEFEYSNTVYNYSSIHNGMSLARRRYTENSVRGL